MSCQTTMLNEEVAPMTPVKTVPAKLMKPVLKRAETTMLNMEPAEWLVDMKESPLKRSYEMSPIVQSEGEEEEMEDEEEGGSSGSIKNVENLDEIEFDPEDIASLSTTGSQKMRKDYVVLRGKVFLKVS